MNKVLLLFSVLVLQFHSQSQTEFYSKLKHAVQSKHPEMDISNKLIGCVVWSMKEEDSREQIKNFEKTLTVFENAKLKGGTKGILFVSVNKDNFSTEAVIFLQKEGIVELIPVEAIELGGSEMGSFQNLVFDSSGNEIYRDLQNPFIFSSINKLITR